MTIHKCRGCNRVFATERGLSSHFQHKILCKSMHYSIPYKDNDLNDPIQTTSVKLIDPSISLTSGFIDNDTENFNNSDFTSNELCIIDNDINNDVKDKKFPLQILHEDEDEKIEI